MKYCKRCLYPENHPLNITFDKDGICSGCKVHEEKDTLDWIKREKKLKKILNLYKNSNPNYDCIIPVDGGKDSYFIVDTIKNKYGLRPLLVYFNKQYNTKLGIRNLQYLKTLFGCDIIESTINPNFAKQIVRYTLERCTSIYWHNHVGTKTFPVQVAVKFKIPLIIWGAHQGIDQVGMFSHTDEVEMTRKYRKEHDLMGFEAEDIVDKTPELKEKYLQKLFYPSNKELSQVGVRGIYLNNYIRWDSKDFHENMIKKYGYETKEQTRTFIPYDRPDCFLYSDLHDYIKYQKFGYGVVTDHVCREIRLGKISRKEGVELVNKYQNIQPKCIDKFIIWSGLEILNFHRIINFNENKKQSSKICNSNFEKLYKLSHKEEIIDNSFTLMSKGWIN
jgi:N-acetyl sugar amidotransferase